MNQQAIQNPCLVIIIGSSESLEAIRSELAAGWVELLPVILGQLRAEAVDGDDEGSPVSLEAQDLTHHVRGLAPDVETEIIKCLQVRLVQGVPDDLNVHLVKVLLVDAAFEKGGQRSVHQHSVVELGRGARNVDGLHLFKTTERMTFSNLGF